VKLLLVEDDLTIAGFIRNGFQQDGFVVNHASDGREALSIAEQTTHDIAIVDLMLPGLDGLGLIRELRARGHGLPILILSARHTVDDRVSGLRSGSDDYLVKPFSFIELQARVEALLRRANPAGAATLLRLADLELDRFARTVQRAGQAIPLQPREFALLEYLLQNPGRILSKTMILEQVWDYQFDPQTNVVDVLVCRLRGKIDRGFAHKLLHTIRGVGYVLRQD